MDAAIDPLASQRRAARSLAARDRLAEAAMRCIAAEGYGGAGVAQIAAEAGLSRNHIFQHFGSKEALSLAALQRARGVWRGDIAQAAQIFPQAQQQLAHAVQALATQLERGWLGLAFISALAQCRQGLPGELSGELDAVLDEMGGFFRNLLKEGRKQGSQRQDIKPRQLSQLCVALILGASAVGSNAAELLGLLSGLLMHDSGLQTGS